MERCVYNHLFADSSTVPRYILVRENMPVRGLGVDCTRPIIQRERLGTSQIFSLTLFIFHNGMDFLESVHYSTINTKSDVLHLDFGKAFDSVDHQILVQKLKCYDWPTLGLAIDYIPERSGLKGL